MIDPGGFAENLALRIESARRTLRGASSNEELCALVAELFGDSVHPFYASKRFPNPARRSDSFNLPEITQSRLIH